ncbi:MULTISPECIES: RNA polymerase sigma factor [Runella]|uniref:RNA polymerase sigma factor n=1 Tax=Runella TaxID=105 RepID=UPI00040DD477|nr:MULTISPECIES: sigma-70 family RNA polymerase sigma factor [Runella]AYQ32502.1 RNA polymerase subunit sigma-70 [Runella sp. SP2]MCA0230123.1 sigma-70 family RNA polymerase sigma factor [Bacteroidota bacterium]HAK75397.1 RNA polymerase subunit sigma-70 [Runella sp.]HAO49253.1 RNA polymerase subunit sigma-70 [Runella sp.]
MGLKTPKLNESELLELLRRQDRKAFNYLYDNYSDALYGVILKVVRTEETAQDLLQEIFVKIWKNIAQYDSSKGRLFTWMLNIARNTSIDYLRVNRLEIQDIDTAVYTVEQGQSIYEEINNNELKEVVSQLKPEQQTLIEMVYWGGYTHEEAAQRLDMPLGTVKTRVRSALRDLRKFFGA